MKYSKVPPDTDRVRFRQMSESDLDEMASLLGDLVVMKFYPAPKTREEVGAWISWNQTNYARYGYGLWVIERLDGQFLGDCGLTWQEVNGQSCLEVGYHLRPEVHGQGYATEAAAACRDYARAHIDTDILVAIIHPENRASERVAEKIGMRHVTEEHSGSTLVRPVLGMALRSSAPGRGTPL